MKIKRIVTVGLILLLAGALPAAAQMMGGGSDMPDMMRMMGRGMHGAAGTTGCPGMAGEATAFGSEGPWISFALAYAKELELSADQVQGLTALRDGFEKEAIRLTGEVRVAEIVISQLLTRMPVDLQTTEAKIRAVAGLTADLRVERLKALEKARALLTPEQQKKLSGVARGRMHGAFMMGDPTESGR